MGNFNRDSRDNGRSFGRSGGGDRRFGGHGGGFGGGRNSGRPMTMHKTTCSKCGNECEVPFRPTGDRPVFCSNCFKTEGGNSGSSRPIGNNFGRPNFTPNHSAGGNNSAHNTDQFKAQFEALNSKLDKILKALTPDISASAPILAKTKAVEAVTKKATTKKATRKKK